MSGGGQERGIHSGTMATGRTYLAVGLGRRARWRRRRWAETVSTCGNQSLMSCGRLVRCWLEVAVVVVVVVRQWRRWW
jgi:hypothetical protein